MSGRTAPALVLDCRGRRCPLPILELARRINEVPVGASLVVEADDPAAGPDLVAWCRIRGHEFLTAATASDGTPVYTLRRLH